MSSSIRKRTLVIVHIPGPRSVGLTGTPQEDDISRKVSGRVGSIGIINDQRVDKVALKEEELETLNIEEKAGMTCNGDVRHHIDYSTKATVHDETPNTQ